MNKNKSGSKIWSWVIFSAMMFVIVIIGISVFTVKNDDGDIIEQKTTVVQKKETMGRDRAEKIIREYADKNGIDFNDYPASIIDLLARNSETEDFVLSYPKEKDKSHKINMKEYKNCKEVPLLCSGTSAGAIWSTAVTLQGLRRADLSACPWRQSMLSRI